MDCQEVIAEEALLVVTDLVGLQPCSRHCAHVTTKEDAAARVAW